MRQILLSLFFLIIGHSVFAINPVPASAPLYKKMEAVLGRKLNLKERIGVRVWEWKLKKAAKAKKYGNAEAKDKAKAAFICGLLGLIFLFVPYLNILSIPLAVIAWLNGERELRKDPGNRKAKTAVTLGKVTIGLLLLFAIVAVAILAFGPLGR